MTMPPLPTVRTLIAVALALAIVATATIAAMLFVRGPLGKLAEARVRQAELEAVLKRPPQQPVGVLPDDRLLRAESGKKAQLALADLLRRKVARSGALVEAVSPAAPGLYPEPVVAITIVASGSGRALLAFVNEAERGTPTIRFVHWRLGPSGDGSAVLRLDAQAIAVADSTL